MTLSSSAVSIRSLMQLFDEKIQEFNNDIDDVHMVWLGEIQQEADRMFSSDFIAEPELMPKTPSQKKNSRRKRVSLGRQEENQSRRRLSRGRRSNLRRVSSTVKTLNLVPEEGPEASTSEAIFVKPKRASRRNKKTQPKVAVDAAESSYGSCEESSELDEGLSMEEEERANKLSKVNNTKPEREPDQPSITAASPPKMPSPEVVLTINAAKHLSSEMMKKPEPEMPVPEVVVCITAADRRSAEMVMKKEPEMPSLSITTSDRQSAEMAKKEEASPGRTATKIAIATSPGRSRRSSVRVSLKLRRSLAGLRHSPTQQALRRASNRSLQKKKRRPGKSASSSNVSEDESMDSEEDGQMMVAAEVPEVTPQEMMDQNPVRVIGRMTRSRASTLTTMQGVGSPDTRRGSTKRRGDDSSEESPIKKVYIPKKSQSAKPNMRSFLHTVQKNKMLMMTPSSLGRTALTKSFIKHATPVKVDLKLSSGGLVLRERMKLEALKKKQEQEEERMKKMEEDKKKKQEELKRKRDERQKRVADARVKGEQKEEEKKKKLEQKRAELEEKNDKLRVERLAEEKAKKKLTALKRQEELEQKRKLEEEARKKKQAEEEKRQQELWAKQKAEEEELRVRKLAEARRAKEQELERERQAAAEREQAERSRALALQREVERAAREKERRELEEKRRKELEEKRMREEEQRLAEERAAKEREAAKAREAAKKMEAAKYVAAANVQLSVMKTPVGKGAALNQTVDIENTVMKTPVTKGAAMNVTVDVEKSPQSYQITPKGGNKPLVLSKNPEDYGMDQNSDDSTDDESAPRKPIPSWAQGQSLQQIIVRQYFNPPDLTSYFGSIEAPKLEDIFYKNKPRYFKRTSSAVWNSPPRSGNQF